MSQISRPDVTEITNNLFISAWPRGDHAHEIRLLNVRLILSMHWFKPSRNLGKPPLTLLWLPTFDNPLLPMPIRTLERGVTAALPVINDGYGVLVHCRAGRHRSVAMACCVLIGLGMSADEAMDLASQRRSVADPHAGYIERRIYKFEETWNSKS